MGIQNVRDLLVARWGVPLVPAIRQDVTITPAAPQQLLKQDPARVAFLIVNVSTSVVTIEPNPSFPGSLFVTWEEDGESVAYEWFAVSIGAPVHLWVYEVLIDQGRQVAPSPGRAA